MKIKKETVLAYLGMQRENINVAMEARVDKMIQKAESLIRPQMLHGIFELTQQADRLVLTNAFSVTSYDLSVLLRYSNKAVLTAVTIGYEIEREIKMLQINEIAAAFILDCCASAAVENLADEQYNLLREAFTDNGFHLTNRFSCGYGDFPIDYQDAIITALKADRRIGLSVDESHLLHPKKSITGIIGLTSQTIHHTHYAGCNTCFARDTCEKRKDGQTCVD